MKAPKRKLFGTDGIRGVVNRFPLTPEMVQKIGMATGYYLKAKFPERRPTVIVGMDTRNSSPMICTALISGLTSVGVDVIDLGITTTPSVSFAVKESDALMGIVVSASHNPFQYNGLKYFGTNGKKFSELEEASLELVIFNKYELPKSSPEEVGRLFNGENLKLDYVRMIEEAGKRLSGLRVALDCGNGATYLLAPKIFRDLGAEVFEFGTEPDGFNINRECGATNPEFLSEKVMETKADIGFSYDGDGDRCIAVDERGNIVDGDQIIALLASHFREKRVVATVMSNIGLELFLRSRGIELLRVPVGDRNVSEKMDEVGSTIGGEQSGHVIVKSFMETGDGILTSILVSSIVRESGKRLSELVSEMRKYPQKLKSLKVKEKKEIERLKRVKRSVEEAEKLLGDRGRVLLRYSGTEPVIRIMVESEDEKLIDRAMEGIIKALEEEGLIDGKRE